jgi:AraC family transcriptional regulator of adaptative response/methylated-DNA-[protein]-cysteine methyltransferase
MRTMYAAFVERDSRFDGVFVAAVKTTGIFCRPTCRARKPNPENVEFFATPREALLHGYRPCKLCRPLEPPGEVPDWLRGLLDEVHTHPEHRLTDANLRRRGLEPSRVRRWFRATHGMTFHAYCRTLRLGLAFGRIREGEDVGPTAFGSGYESLSGFGEAFKKTMGFSPGESVNRQIVRIARIPSPLGPMLGGATEDGVCLLEFADRRMLETQLSRLRARLNAEIVPGRSDHLTVLTEQVGEYFDGERRSFDVPLVMAGTPFQERVWESLRAIPFGETRSYQQQAEAIGQPKAVRAVARANGDNRIAILVPCHRVIGKNGTLTGYGGGLWRKKHLLDLEQTALG